MITIVTSYPNFGEGPKVRGPVSVFVQPWLTMILHVHQKRVDRLDLEKIAENYVFW